LGPKAVLTDARSSLIEGPGEPQQKLNAIADVLAKAVEGMRAEAQKLKPAKETTKS
jgi:hypothetical protein